MLISSSHCNDTPSLSGNKNLVQDFFLFFPITSSSFPYFTMKFFIKGQSMFNASQIKLNNIDFDKTRKEAIKLNV